MVVATRGRRDRYCGERKVDRVNLIQKRTLTQPPADMCRKTFTIDIIDEESDGEPVTHRIRAQ